MYKPLYTQTFKECVDKYKDKKKRVERLVSKILEDPTHKSHLLIKKKGIDLRGKRRRHLDSNFVVIYVVCDECIENEFRDKGYNDCAVCTGKPLKRVIFLAFDKHQDIYSREWYA